MNIDFKRNRLKKQLSNASEVKKAFGVRAKKVQQRLDDIEASPTLYVLKQIKAANCHSLEGNRNGEWALDVSPNFRLTFEIDHNPVPIKEDGSVDEAKVTNIRILEIEDYH